MTMSRMVAAAAAIGALALGACAGPAGTGGDGAEATGPGRATEAGLAARGNEPGWTLEIADGRLVYVGDYGETRLEAPVEGSTRRDGATVYRAATEAGPLTVMVRETLCGDSMTGMPYPRTVTVETPERNLSGCGGDPAALLADGPWRVVALAGETVPADSAPTLDFDAQGGLAGSAGCNRYRATYTLTGEGLTVGPAAATLMACPDRAVGERETRFLAFLETVRRFSVEPDGRLVLHAEDGRRLVAARV
ncbi:MAG: META domain-containing protein [Azospirillaceae bacterium]